MKINLVLIMITGCILLSGTHVLSDDISMSSDQSEYYYPTGTEAQVPFTIESSFQNTLIGTLQYSLTRYQDDGGFSISQTSTQSQSFPIAPGRSNHGLTLSSEEETNYDLSLLLQYSQNGKEYAVVLPPISVHFVHDSKDIRQEKNIIRSNTSEATKTPSSSETIPFSAMDQQIEQMRQEQEQLMQSLISQSNSRSSSGSEQQSQKPEQALQNNQMASSSQALQQQLSAESKRAQEDKQKLTKSLESDPLIQKQAADLKKAGYNQTNGNIYPKGPDNGDISVDFENKEGEKLSVTGKAENNRVSSLTAEKSGEIPVPSELAANTTWNELKESIRNSSMEPSSGSVIRTPENTTVSQSYSGSDGRNATLSARIVNGSVEEVKLEEDEVFPTFWLIGILLVIILVVLCGGVAWWYVITRKDGNHISPEIIPPARNYREIVDEMMERAERSYNSGEKKEGYVLLGQAIRTFVSHTYGTGVAYTSEEIVSGKSRLIIPEKERVISILNSCSVVEYMKGEPYDEEFFRMLSSARDMTQIQT